MTLKAKVDDFQTEVFLPPKRVKKQENLYDMSAAQ